VIRRFATLVIATVSLTLVLAAELRAQAIEPAKAEPSATWYGWQTLIADGLSMPTAVVSYRYIDDAGELFALSVTSAIVTPAIIHGAHGNWSAFGLSLGLRTGSAVLLGMGLLSGFEDHTPNRPISSYFVVGGLMMLSASLIDATLAFEEPPARPEARAWTVSPWASPRDRAGGLSLSGQF
jgi:hypothetical protein